MYYIVGIVFVFIASSILVLLRQGGGNFPWIKFYVKGRESGFSWKEVDLLRRVAVENHLQDPTALFWSVKLLDRSIRGLLTKMDLKENGGNTEDIQFISKLFDFRKSIELKLPKYTNGLKSTREISMRQPLKISIPNHGVYYATVIENLRRYMAISHPVGPALPRNFSWVDKTLSIYFWRKSDAGYTFESRVLNDYIDRKYPILHISHADSLVRTQKRNSVRIQTDMPCYLFPLTSIQHADGKREDPTRGLRCRLRDLSEDGAAVLIGGRAKAGLSSKIQFNLSKGWIVMNGVIKSVNYNKARNQSLLHIQTIPLNMENKNRLLAYIYNIFEEREESSKGTRAVSYER